MSYKHFDNDNCRKDLLTKISNCGLRFDDSGSDEFFDLCWVPLDAHALRKQKYTRAYSRKQRHACGITKKGLESPVNVKLWIFTTHFSKFRALGTLHPSKRHMLLEFLVKNKVFYFLKRALRAGTTHSKWLKTLYTQDICHL